MINFIENAQIVTNNLPIIIDLKLANQNKILRFSLQNSKKLQQNELDFWLGPSGRFSSILQIS